MKFFYFPNKFIYLFAPPKYVWKQTKKTNKYFVYIRNNSVFAAAIGMICLNSENTMYVVFE